MSSTAESIVPGAGGLPKVNLVAEDGAQAEIYLQGAQVTSWKLAGHSANRLFLSPHAEFRPGAAIRGGVPVIFPQFSTLGRLPRHGFARTMEWRLVQLTRGAQASATFQLQSNRKTLAIWPHAFEATLVVTVSGSSLELALSIANTGDKPFSFTGALHTYLQVDNILTTTIEGLAGVRYRDTLAGDVELQEQHSELELEGETDRIYFNVPSPLTVREPGRSTEVSISGFPDVVIWNPWLEKSSVTPDLGAVSYRHMLCVEAAVVGTPVALDPAEQWSGRQTLLVQRR